MARKGSIRFCPNYKQLRETRVVPNGYKQLPMGNVTGKRRMIICGKDRYGTNGCGSKWFTIETIYGHA